MLSKRSHSQFCSMLYKKNKRKNRITKVLIGKQMVSFSHVPLEPIFKITLTCHANFILKLKLYDLKWHNDNYYTYNCLNIVDKAIEIGLWRFFLKVVLMFTPLLMGPFLPENFDTHLEQLIVFLIL